MVIRRADLLGMVRGRPVALVVVAALVAVTLAGAALAVDESARIKGLLRQASEALGRKDLVGAKTQIAAALESTRQAAALTIPAAIVVNEEPAGLGRYQAAPGGVVQGRHLRLYIELEGFALTPSPTEAGTSAVALDVVGAFSYEDGAERVPLGDKPLGHHAFSTHRSESLTSFGVDVQLGEKSPAGTYHVVVKVTDAASRKTAERDVAFTLNDTPPPRDALSR